jgi:hypothetical protein
MFVIEDGEHAEPEGEFATLEAALRDLREVLPPAVRH